MGIKHVIAVGSGKGGVGKSTTAVNLAVALAKFGAKVGLMDADIYGPSVPRLVGSNHEPTQNPETGKIRPAEKYGLKMMSMGLIGGQTPVMWRGPMASKAVSEFLSEVDWGELDYLVVDLPPGTGDIQITLSQAARLSGAVMVMTPQILATEIASRGIKMFQRVRVPVIGIVENMADYECPKCHHREAIFGHGGGAKTAKELGLPLLASFSLDPAIVQESDTGVPVVISRPESESAKRYLELARRMAAELSSLMAGARTEKPMVVSMEPNAPAKMFKVNWSDGRQSVVAFKELRYHCPCANCVDENTGKRTIKKENIADDIQALRVQTVGNYAVSIKWSDGHDTGIYAYDYLHKLLVK